MSVIKGCKLFRVSKLFLFFKIFLFFVLATCIWKQNRKAIIGCNAIVLALFSNTWNRIINSELVLRQKKNNNNKRKEKLFIAPKRGYKSVISLKLI